MAREVRVSLVIDEHGAVKALRTTADESDKTEHKLGQLDKGVKELGKSFGGLKGLVGMGLGALGAGGLAFGLKDIASKTGEIAEETHKFSSISGFGTNTSLRYTAALKAKGISAEAGGRMFAFLAKNVQTAERQQYMFASSQDKAAAKGKQATGLLGVQATAFEKLGINLSQFRTLSEEAKFDLVIKKFEAMKSGMQKTAFAKEIFGKGGQEMLQILGGGALGLSHMTEMAKKFFPTITGEGKQAMDELMVKQAESKMAWEGLEFTLGEKVVPAMTTVDSWFSKLAVSIEHGRGIWGSLESTLGTGVHDFEDIYGWLGKNKWAVDALGYSVAGLGVLWGTSKVIDFVSAIGKLSVIKGLAGMVGGEAAAVEGESAVFAGAGTMLGGAFAVAFAAAVIFKIKPPESFGGEHKGPHGKGKGTKDVLELASSVNPFAPKGTIGEAGSTPAEERAAVLHWERSGLRPGISSPIAFVQLARRERQFAAEDQREHPTAARSHLDLHSNPFLGGDTVVHHQTILQLDGRVVAEANERYGLKRAARR